MGNERDGNALLAAVKKFEDWSGLRISIAKSFVTGALTQAGAERRRAESKLEERKNKKAPRHDAGSDGDALLARLACSYIGDMRNVLYTRHDSCSYVGDMTHAHIYET